MCNAPDDYIWVTSEASDMYVIPYHMKEHWFSKGMFGNGDGTYPKYAKYAPKIKFKKWEEY